MIKALSPLFKRLQSVASFAGPSLLDQTLVSGLNFLVGIYLAYRLGLNEFGQFSLILVVTFFCLEIQRAIILAPMMTFIAKKNVDGYAQSVNFLMVGCATVLTVLGAAFIKISDSYFPLWGIAAYAAPCAALIFFRVLQEFLRRFLFIHNRPYYALYIDIIISIIVVVGLAVLQYSGQMDVANVVLLHGIAYGVGFLIGVPSLRQTREWPSKEMIAHSIKRHWQFGRWLFAGVIATYASSNLLLLTGSAELGSEAAGLIKTAQYLMGGMIVLFQAMENIIPYRMAQLTEQTPQELKKFFLHTLCGMMAFCILHGFLIYLLIDPISSLVAPGREHEMRPIAVANIFFTGLLVISYCLQYILRALEYTKPIFWANATTAIFSLVSGPFFIHRYGVIGITYGLFIIQIMLQIICVLSLASFWRGKK